MGNSSSSPSGLTAGTIFQSKAALVHAAEEYNHALSKACRIYRSQNSVLHIVCVHQYQSMCKTNRLNCKEKKRFVAAGGVPKNFKKKYINNALIML